MKRLRVIWSGSAVTGTGVSTFHFLDTATGVSAAVAAFLQIGVLNYPAGLTITVPTTGETIDAATGDITGTWSEGGSPTVITGTNTAGYAQGVGAQVRWRTLAVINSRRVVGSTFLVPITGAAFQSDGSLSTALQNTIQTNATALIAAQPNMVVWTRPRGGAAGGDNIVTSATVPDRPSWLRSRRT